jgi:restriction system protein
MWEYSESSRLFTLRSVHSKQCIWCHKELHRLDPIYIESDRSQRKLIAQLSVCPHCGWWTAYRVHQGDHPRTSHFYECYDGIVGSLKEFDPADISVPIEDVRRYLQINSERVYDLHPRVFEEVVGSVFRDHGWRVKVTAYTGDDGVDVVLTDGAKTVGVQVKKNKKERKIEAEQIRALAGALVLNGMTEGVFVTTSSYRKGAVLTAASYCQRGYHVHLLDCKRFFEALEIAQLRSFSLDEETFRKRIFSKGAYVGSGDRKRFRKKEDIYSRKIISSSFLEEEFIDLYGPQPPHFGS